MNDQNPSSPGIPSHNQSQYRSVGRSYYYVLGWEQPNNKVAILCRGSSGPLLCQTWKESLKARTGLLNDPRTKQNPHALRIIEELRIYRLPSQEALIWRPGDLWIYMDKRSLEKME